MSLSKPIALAVVLAACGGGETDQKTTTAVPDWQPQSEGVVVATVGGEPIYDDCVIGTMTERGLDRREALESCIDFELLAQEARRRGLASEEALDVRRNEAVRRLIDESFYATFKSADDVPLADVKKLWDRGLKNFYNRSENRTTFYCRAGNPVGKRGRTPLGGEEDRTAKIAADAIYAELKGKTDLTLAKVKETCERVGAEVGGAKISSGRFVTTFRGRAVPEYADAVFAVKETGSVSPPTRTGWGWDIILLIDILPAASHTFEEATPKIRDQLFNAPEFEGYRRERFSKFLASLVNGAPVERFDERLGPAPAGPSQPGPAGGPRPSPPKAPGPPR